jgi:hypothetical protein
MKASMFLSVLLLSGSAAAQAALIDAAPIPDAQPQREDVPEVLASPHGRIFHNGGYAAPMFGITNMNGEVAPTFGLRGVWRVNRRFGLGLTGTALELNDFKPSEKRMQVGYGGLLLEYVTSSNRLAHGMFDLTLGGGALCRDSRESARDCREHAQTFFVAEPTANLELNVTSFMRIDAGAGYRLALTRDRDNLSSSDLSGFVGRIGLAFGRF